MSTQRYRLPVRRYILDMFNIELDAEVVAALLDNAEKLKPHPSNPPSKSNVNRMSMFGRMGRTRRNSESDEDEVDEMDVGVQPRPTTEGQPPICLQPVKKIVGFDL